MNFLEKKYSQFIFQKGYIPKYFNSYNFAELENIAPTQTRKCGNEASSSAVLISQEILTKEFKILQCFDKQIILRRKTQMNEIHMMRELVKTLNEYAEAYYVYDTPIVSDKEYDTLYDRLAELEDITGMQLSNSPTVKVQGRVLDGFTKIEHTKPMLSAEKTKDPKMIERWLKGRKYYCSYKADGLTLVLRYSNGKFIQAITRGNGYVGEDVTEQAKLLNNIPLSISYYDNLEVRGECVCSWEEFNRINENIETPFSHPRNLAAGTIRNLDTNILKDRKLSFLAFECVTDIGVDDKVEILQRLNNWGFEVIPFAFDSEGGLDKYIEIMKAELCKYPVDGLIFELRSREESLNTESTAHHEGCRIALKWEDNTYTTTLTDIEWNTSRSGFVAPVAIFEPVDLDGATTSRATLHNVSIIENLKLGIGDKITVYKANMIIPAIDENLTKSNTYKLPTHCPACGAELEMKISATGTKNLFCVNPNCHAQFINKIIHYVSRSAMDIEGISEAIIEMLYNKGFVKTYSDLYGLEKYKDELIKINGFGEKSYNNLIEAINKSTHTTLDRFIVAIGIPNVGKAAAKLIAKQFGGNFNSFISETAKGFNYTTIDTFGDIINESIHKWLNDFPKDELIKLKEILAFDTAPFEKKEINDNPFINKNICVTGKLNSFTRDSINAKIESIGAKAVSGVTSKTDYLITNTPDSGSSKNNNAKKYGTKIITEEEFLKMIGEV